MLRRQRRTAAIVRLPQRGGREQGLLWEITQVKTVWFVLTCELMSKTCINPQGVELTHGTQRGLFLDSHLV